MKICVLGNGLLASEFEKLQYEVINYNYSDLILEDITKYDIVINTYDYHGDDMNAMINCNVNLPLALSTYCQDSKKRYVHLSTAELYKGSDTPVEEIDIINSGNPYLASKLLGESVCNKRSLIIRASNLFNGDPINENAIYKAITNSTPTKNQESYTWGIDAVRSIIRLLKNKKFGVYNVSSEGYYSQADICTKVGIVNMAPTFDNNTEKYVKLDIGKLNINFVTFDAMVNIQSSFDDIVRQLGE